MPARCSVCAKPVTPEHAPFCSQGCRDRDLIQWLDEGYRVPVPQHEDPEDGLDSPLSWTGGLDSPQGRP